MQRTLPSRLGAALAVVLLAGSLAQAAITIQTVPVGNTGNTADTATHSGGYLVGQGAVNYVYNIGKYEVTAGQYTAFLNAVAATDTYALYNTQMADTSTGSGISRSGSSGSYTYSVDSAFVGRPVNHVTFWNATRFANWLHNGQPTGAQNNSTTEDGAYTLTPAGITANTITRNPGWHWAVTSEDEWYKAAFHMNDGNTGNYFNYPTSSLTAPGRDMADVSGNNANRYNTTPYPIDSGGYYTTVGGEFQNSESPYGTFDQGGNVWEWSDSILNGTARGQRGGAYNTHAADLQSTARHSRYPTIQETTIGFRVVQIPEPGSMAILALGVPAMLIRRRGDGR